MNSIVAGLREIRDLLDSAADDAFGSEEIPGLSDADVVEVLTLSGQIQRRLEGVQIESTVQVRDRSEGLKDEKLTLAYGCARPADLVRMLLGSDSRTAAALTRAARLVRRERSFTEGVFLPARYQALREAVADGVIGLSGLLSATGPIERSARRITEDARIDADRQLANLARGVDPDADALQDPVPGPLPLPEDLGLYAQVIVAYIDPDGAEPIDDIATRARGLTIGRVGAHGTVPVRGDLLPEVAAQLNLLMDSLLNPRVDEPDAPGSGAATGAGMSAGEGVRFEESSDDDSSRHDAEARQENRTRAQKQHDALAAILNTAARTDLFPHLGGAAPTLVVSTGADDYAAGTGWARIMNTGSLIPQRVAAQTGCAGGIQRVLFDDHGRIVSIGTSARIFNALQRRAIMLRDGGCIIPGCTIPATWCEIHHVTEHAAGGPTHTDNGVLLCWFHHRSLHLTEWVIRMDRGVPEVRGPAWWDPHQHWHRSRSPHRRQPVPG